MHLFFWRRVRPRVICYGSCDSHFDRTGPSTRLEPWRLSTTSILNRKGGSALGLASSAAEKKRAAWKKLPAGDEVPRRRQGLFEFFGHDGELKLGLGERLHDGSRGVLRRGIA